MTKQLSSHYIDLIKELDKTIDMVRTFWIESRDEFERDRNMKRLNELLDERIRLIKYRDAGLQIEGQK